MLRVCQGFVINGSIGQLSSDAKQARRLRNLPVFTPIIGDRRFTAEVTQNLMHRQLTRNLARCLTAHSITNHKNLPLKVITEVILVVCAYTTDIAFARGLDGESHPRILL